MVDGNVSNCSSVLSICAVENDMEVTWSVSYLFPSAISSYSEETVCGTVLPFIVQ